MSEAPRPRRPFFFLPGNSASVVRLQHRLPFPTPPDTRLSQTKIQDGLPLLLSGGKTALYNSHPPRRCFLRNSSPFCCLLRSLSKFFPDEVGFPLSISSFMRIFSFRMIVTLLVGGITFLLREEGRRLSLPGVAFFLALPSSIYIFLF